MLSCKIRILERYLVSILSYFSTLYCTLLEKLIKILPFSSFLKIMYDIFFKLFYAFRKLERYFVLIFQFRGKQLFAMKRTLDAHAGIRVDMPHLDYEDFAHRIQRN